MASRPEDLSGSSEPAKPWSEFQDPTSANQEKGPSRIQMPVLTEEEKLIMKECERDSFYLRALPLSVGTMTGAFFMVKNGRWSPHPRFGAFPKMMIAGSIGYFFGKLTYVPVCQQKILEKIPNSNLAATIRKSKGLPNPDAQVPAWEESAIGINKSKSNEYRPSEGIDDRFRPSMDRDVKEPATPQQEKGIIAYEELRRRNRQEYEDNLSKRQERQPPSSSPSYKESPFMPQKPWPEADDQKKSDTEASPPVQAPPKRKRTNMWGDVIEE